MSKRRFPGDDDSDESSSEDDAPSNVVRGNSGYGGGKQFRPSGGKQLRPPQESESESESESEDEQPQQQSYTNYSYQGGSRYGGGKQFRPAGGKQLRVQQSESEDNSSSEEEEDEQPPPPPPPPRPIVPQYRGGGKQLMRMEHMKTQQYDDESSSSSEEEPPAPQNVVVPRSSYGGGKSFRPPIPQKDETSDSDEESEDEASGSEDESDQEVQQQQVPRSQQQQQQQQQQQHIEPPEQTQPTAPEPTKDADEDEEEEDDDDDDDDDEDGDDMDIDEEEEDEGADEKRVATKAPKEVPAVPPPKEKPVEKDEESVEDSVDMESSSDESDDSSEGEFDMDLDSSVLVKDAKDKKYLESLTEFERENILASRFEARKEKAEMRKALKESKRQERSTKGASKPKKTSKKKSDLAEKSSKASKVSAADKKPKIADDSDEEEKPTKTTTQKKPFSDDESDDNLDFGDDDDDDDFGGDDESDDEDEKVAPWTRKNTAPTTIESDDDFDTGKDLQFNYRSANFVEADYEDFLKLSLPRRRLARWCNEPFFERAVKSCYVRLGAGIDKKNGKKRYKLFQITGVEKKSDYSFPKTPGTKRAISTNKYLRVKHGKQTNSIKMIMVSDSHPQEDEVAQYMNQLKSLRSNEVLSKKKAAKTFKLQQDLVNNYSYTKEDIEKLVKEKKKTGNKVFNIGKERTIITLAVQGAKNEIEETNQKLDQIRKQLGSRSLKDDEVDDLKRERNELEDLLTHLEDEYKVKQAEHKRIMELDEGIKKRLKNTKNVQNLSRVNQRAVSANKRADYDAYKHQRLKESEQALDPYARRKVKPKNLWEVGQSKKEEEKPSDSTTNDKPQLSKTSDEKAKETGGNHTEKETKLDDNVTLQENEIVHQSHQFAIDEELLVNGTMSGTGKRAGKRPRIRRGISLEEYQSRKAAGTL